MCSRSHAMEYVNFHLYKMFVKYNVVRVVWAANEALNERILVIVIVVFISTSRALTNIAFCVLVCASRIRCIYTLSNMGKTCSKCYAIISPQPHTHKQNVYTSNCQWKMLENAKMRSLIPFELSCMYGVCVWYDFRTAWPIWQRQYCAKKKPNAWQNVNDRDRERRGKKKKKK